jgi:hypothetical protein
MIRRPLADPFFVQRRGAIVIDVSTFCIGIAITIA